MGEHELELRLRSVANALDADAPVLDAAALGAVRPRRFRPAFAVLAAVVAVAGVAVAPAAISALGDVFHVEVASELRPVPADVVPGYLGPPVTLDAARASVPFELRTIPSLGAPDSAHKRDDIGGGMVTLAYRGAGALLTQWTAADVGVQVTVVPAGGTAEDATVGPNRALWIAGTARGTFTVVGADGLLHRELFDVADGALLWRADGVAFLLQGAGTKENAARLAAGVTL
jgi:hypothetical protein